MTAEKILRITKEEIEVINSLFEIVSDFVNEIECSESFESVLTDIVGSIYYNQSVTDEYRIKIITE